MSEQTVTQPVGSAPQVPTRGAADLAVGDVATPLCEWYVVAGAHCALSTNNGNILAAARKSFRQVTPPRPIPDLTMRLWVDAEATGHAPWPQAYFRGLAHLVYAGFGSTNSLLLDLRRRHVIGRFSPAMAGDEQYWLRAIFPSAIGLMSEALGVTALHCACVERDGSGLLLAGGSGSGKSTLALALARNGLALLSDDWTYFSRSQQRLNAWGIVSPVKLLPDAIDYFPELGSLSPQPSLNGELAYEIDPQGIFGVQRSLHCQPRRLVFLERQETPGHAFLRVTPQEAAARLEFDLEDLSPELAHVRQKQSEIIQDLTAGESWILRHGENPHDLAQVLTRFCTESGPATSPTPRPDDGDGHHLVTGRGLKNGSQTVRTAPDIIRRFTPAPRGANLRGGNCAIRLETNSPAILQQVQQSLEADGSVEPGAGQFLWRLVSEADGYEPSTSPRPSSFSADGLHLETLDQRCFFVLDAAAGIAIGFLPESLAANAAIFRKLFLDRLVSATAAYAGGLT
jgi:hypothetical protein